MRRRQLFEFEDLAWFPGWLRDYLTDYLRVVVEKFDLFGPVIPLLAELLQRTGRTRVVDLASGAGGPWPTLLPRLQEQVPELQLTLTDLYPNQRALDGMARAFPHHVGFEADPTDARAVPDHVPGLRTQFLSLHHFAPEDVRAIFANTVAAGEPIAIFEAQQRDLRHVVNFALAPIMVWILTPFIRPFRWRRLAVTYPLPLVPFFVGWDGVVSALRTYTPDEMLEMARTADPEERFDWDAGLLPSGPMKIPYLVGQPKTG